MMSATPLISVIVPVYNVENYLSECIQSLVCQTYDNIEIILVDDGSTDKSGLICDSMAESDSRIRVIHQNNQGISAARNVGIENARGEFISFVDSDDVVSLEMIATLYRCFLSHPEVKIVSGQYRPFIDGDSIPYEDGVIESGHEIISQDRFAKYIFGRKCYVSSRLFLKEIITSCRFTVNRIDEDTLFMYDVVKYMKGVHSPMVVCQDVLYFYRQRANSITYNVNKPLFVERIHNLECLENDALTEYPSLVQRFSELKIASLCFGFHV